MVGVPGESFVNSLTLTIIAAVVGAGIGAAAGVIFGRLFGLGRNGVIGVAVAFAVIAGIGAHFLVQSDAAPKKAFDDARAAADALPDVAAVKQYYPDQYAVLEKDLDVLRDQKLGAAGVRDAVRRQLTPLVKRQAKLADDANLLALMKLSRDKGAALLNNPAYCHQFFTGGRLTFNPETIFPAALVQQDHAVSAALLKQTATTPLSNAAGARVDDGELKSRVREYYEVQLRDEVIDRVQAGFNPDERKQLQLLAGRKVSLEGDTVRQGMLCRYNIALLDETLKLPADKAAMVYRLNLARGF